MATSVKSTDDSRGKLKAPAPSPRKKKKHKNQDAKKKPEIEKTQFGDNVYTGIVHKTALAGRYFEGTAAKYAWSNGVKYEGPFVDSQIEGVGKFSWPDGSFYEGGLRNGKRHGEGCHTLVDGVTQYAGQWLEGKRHGIGRLTYDQSGESYYHGEWTNDMKHGHGSQRWPSGNIYVGQWRYGRMSGQGEMAWHDGHVLERYCGNWEANLPTGEGTHTWHALEPGEGNKELPSQQMNNRYQGSWKQGVRHGKGTFYYANGSKYSGEWLDNIKHGEGQYTYDDGKVYRGLFLRDQMCGDKPFVEQEAQAGPKVMPLNIGAQDNPVRKCIDISDLAYLCAPCDVSASAIDVDTRSSSSGACRDTVGESTPSTSKSIETEEVMRTVFNMLLRNFGDMKLAYAQYRPLARWPGSDPFTLSMLQLWVFARDMGILTPTCSIGSLDRAVRSGPRFHSEVAYGDLEELRPLTPRVEESIQRASCLRATSIASQNPGRHGSVTTLVNEGGEERSSYVESGLHSPDIDNESQAVMSDSGMSSLSQESMSTVAVPSQNRFKTMASQNDTFSPINASLLDLTPVPEFTSFWRDECGNGLADIHDPSTTVMLRHFLESIVRMSIARYPNDAGLERQFRRLSKEHLLAKFGQASTSDWIMTPIVDEGVRQVLADFEPALWVLFKNLATGEGAYRPPPGRIPAEGEKEAHGESPDAAVIDLLQDYATLLRTRHRGLGGNHRRVHVKARLDITLRVKDLLQLLRSVGLLQPMEWPGQRPLPQSGQDNGTTADGVETPHFDPFSEVFPCEVRPISQGESVSGQQQSLNDTHMTPIEGLDGLRLGLEDNGAGNLLSRQTSDGAALKDFRDQFKENTAASKTGPLEGAAEATKNTEDTGATNGQSLKTDEAEVQETSFVPPDPATSGEPSHPDPAVPVETSEVLQCDFSVSFLDILRIVTEVLAPESVQKLRWNVRCDDPPAEGFVSLLDYLETELTFVEFRRTLLQLADRQILLKDPTSLLSQRLPFHRRFEGFLQHVFFPALVNPYQPPVLEGAMGNDGLDQQLTPTEGGVDEAAVEPPPEVPVKESKKDDKKDARKGSKEKPGAKKNASKEPVEPPPAEEPLEKEVEPPPPDPPSFWLGFDVGDDGSDSLWDAIGVRADAEEAASCRAWLECYHLEVLDW